MARGRKKQTDIAGKAEITSQVEVVPVEPVLDEDALRLKKFLEDFKISIAQLCEDIDYGSVTLVKQIFNGELVMPILFKNRFLSYERQRRKSRGI